MSALLSVAAPEPSYHRYLNGRMLPAEDAMGFELRRFEGCLLFTAPCHHEGRLMYAPYEGRAGCSVADPAVIREAAVDHARMALKGVSREEFDALVIRHLGERAADVPRGEGG